MSIDITVEGGKSVLLPTAGKYCDQDIVITATGGGGEGSNGIYMAKITPAADVDCFTIQHNLGTTDILFCLVWAETLGDYVPTVAQALTNVWLKTDIPTRVSSSVNRANFEAQAGYNPSSENVTTVGLKNSSAYFGKPTSENTFVVMPGSSNAARFYGGVTYTVIIMAASAFSAS